jgi:hypothetical protein
MTELTTEINKLTEELAKLHREQDSYHVYESKAETLAKEIKVRCKTSIMAFLFWLANLLKFFFLSFFC